MVNVYWRQFTDELDDMKVIEETAFEDEEIEDDEEQEEEEYDRFRRRGECNCGRCGYCLMV